MEDIESIALEARELGKVNAEAIRGLQSNSEEIKTDVRSLNKLSESLIELAGSVKVMAEHMSSVEEKVDGVASKTDELKKEIAAVKEVPANEDHQIVSTAKLAAISAVVGIIVSAIMNLIIK